MMANKQDFHNRAIDEVKRLWHMYILGEKSAQLEEELNKLPEHFLMIGTGRHEFYQSRSDFLSGMSKDQMEAQSIKFELQDEWYEVQDISDTVCAVYGSIWAREKVLVGQTAFVDMQGSRFSVICRDSEQGIEICTVHHSMPYIEQGADEYYPKTLSSIAKELEHKVELDRMTDFYSNYYMQQYVTSAMNKSDGYFIVLDLDDFKSINDTKGHLVGDQVISSFAKTIKRIASSNAILGRMGGDEFAVWDAQLCSKSKAEEKFADLLLACEEISTQLGVQVTCSAGIVFCQQGERVFTSIYNKADQALYYAKRKGKKQLQWAEQ